MNKVEEMRSLEVYRNKQQMEEEKFYDNSFSSVLLFRCRSNTLKLGWRLEKEGGSPDCKLCGEERETLTHFFMECPSLQGIREANLEVSSLRMDQILLFKSEQTRKVKPWMNMRYIEKLWSKRKELMES